MNSKPRIFEITAVVNSPLESAIIINNTKDKNIKCPLCHNKSFITTKYLIQGYDNFLEYNLSEPAFLGFNFEPLYTTESNAKLIVNSLSGCTLAKVDYDDWNQTVYIKLWRKKPFLGAIDVTPRK
ncbi:hypothetical protein AAEX28_15090 [Lentisphaerota bacterium WC36G]|nr:hypothetical protein LJT99_01845 [Lentisphaerae bacterium WC36]